MDGRDILIVQKSIALLGAAGCLYGAEVTRRQLAAFFDDMLAAPGIGAVSNSPLLESVPVFLSLVVNRLLARWARRAGSTAVILHRFHLLLVTTLAVVIWSPVFEIIWPTVFEIDFFVISVVQSTLLMSQSLLLAILLLAFVFTRDARIPTA